MLLRCSIFILSMYMLTFFQGCLQSSPVMPDIDSPDPPSEVIEAIDQFVSEICKIGIESGSLPESENPDQLNDESD
jgi:hypothetical protein